MCMLLSVPHTPASHPILCILYCSLTLGGSVLPRGGTKDVVRCTYSFLGLLEIFMIKWTHVTAIRPLSQTPMVIVAQVTAIRLSSKPPLYHPHITPTFSWWSPIQILGRPSAAYLQILRELSHITRGVVNYQGHRKHL